MIDVWKMTRVFARIKPEIVFSYFIKPVIIGSIAARFARVPHCFAMIEGLGYSFDRESGNSIPRRFLQQIAKLLLKFSFGSLNKVFFLNHDDVELLVKAKVVSIKKAIIIDGIGLDLDWYVPAEPSLKPITFLLVARMLKEKGIYDFITAAREVRSAFPEVKFLLVGAVDQNPSSIEEDELRRWVGEGLIEWTGWVDDVRPWLAKASVFVLPSFYREGLPRSTQEAMAMGRPVITTDWVGCRETVTDGVNGFLVPICNPKSLAQAMRKFIEQPDLIKTMGIESRRIAEARFNVHTINRQIMDVLKLTGPTFNGLQPKEEQNERQ
jgi:glycosyltransferase involved in cell wall biosynthesis